MVRIIGLSTGSHELSVIWVHEGGIIIIVSFKFNKIWTTHCISGYFAIRIKWLKITCQCYFLRETKSSVTIKREMTAIPAVTETLAASESRNNFQESGRKNLKDHL